MKRLIKTDPFEKTRRYRKLRDELEEKIVKQIGNGGYIGYCHRYWAAKKRILAEDYGVDWHSPDELNPDMMFD